MKNKPNVFIIGAPKCGTTALCQYLQSHPEVFMCTPKEPHFFAHEDMPNQKYYFQDLESYLGLFSNANDSHRVIMEGSVWYLYSENAVKRIRQFDEQAKLIIMLRRPDEMVYSFHSQALVSFDEDVEDFNVAWNMAIDPRPRTQIPKQCLEPKLLMYDKIAQFGHQLQQVYKHFPKDQVKLIFYEDFSENVPKTYTDTLDYLGINHSHRPEFERVNPNTVIKHRSIGKYIEHPPQFLLNALSVFKRALGIKEIKLKEKLKSLNTAVKKRPALDEKIRREIIENYRTDIELLQKITNRNLSHWLE